MRPVAYRVSRGFRPARVFLLQLGWSKAQEDADTIAGTMVSIQEACLYTRPATIQISCHAETLCCIH